MELTEKKKLNSLLTEEHHYRIRTHRCRVMWRVTYRPRWRMVQGWKWISLHRTSTKIRCRWGSTSTRSSPRGSRICWRSLWSSNFQWRSRNPNWLLATSRLSPTKSTTSSTTRPIERIPSTKERWAQEKATGSSP